MLKLTFGRAATLMLAGFVIAGHDIHWLVVVAPCLFELCAELIKLLVVSNELLARTSIGQAIGRSYD